MVIMILLLLIGMMPLSIDGMFLDCLKNHWPGVKPFNSTHIKVGWAKGDGSGFENCVESPPNIKFEKYKITLDGQSLGEQSIDTEKHSAVIKGDPCLKHDVMIELDVHNDDQGDEQWKATKTAHYNDINETESLFSNLLKEDIKHLCKVGEKFK